MKEQKVVPEQTHTMELVNQALREIYAHREGLSTVLDKYGRMRLSTYSREVLGGRESSEENPEIETLSMAIKKEAAILEPLYGKDIYETISRSLESNRVVNTGPHHGIFTHPYFVGDLILSTMSKLEESGESITVIADASVPLRNLTYGAGFVLTETNFDENSQSEIPVKLHLTPSHRDTAMVAAKPFTKKEVSDTRTQVTAFRDRGVVSKEKASIIWRTLGEFGNNPHIMNANSFSEQSTYINAVLYPRMFTEDMRTSLPKIVYLDSERVMTNALLNLLKEKNPLFESILFEPKIRKEFVEMSGQVDVAKSTDLLFTTMESGERAPMNLDESGEFLTYPNRTNRKRDVKNERFSLTRENILDGLQQGRVYPGASLIFAMLGHYGIDSTGGFNQSIGYLPKFYQNYAQHLDRWGTHGEARKMQARDPYRISTTLSPVFVRRKNNLQQAGLFDILNRDAYNENDSPSKGLSRIDLTKMGDLTLEQLVKVNIPTIYNMVVPEEERRPDLSSLTTEEIAQALNVADKITVIEEK